MDARALESGTCRVARQSGGRSSRLEATFAVADVRECYASISPETITALLGPEGAQAVPSSTGSTSEACAGSPSAEPSAVLANAALSRDGRAIRNAGVRHLRWVDDVILWGSAEEVRTAMVAMRTAGEAIGLELHRGKTSDLRISKRRPGAAR